MRLAGLQIEDHNVITLAGRLRNSGFEDTAERLENAYDLEVLVLGLSIPEREEILRTLEERTGAGGLETASECAVPDTRAMLRAFPSVIAAANEVPEPVAEPVASIKRCVIRAAGDLEVAALRSCNLAGGVLHGKVEGDALVVTKARRACLNEKPDALDLHFTKELCRPVDGAVVCGDFHTHPTGGLKPSPTDERTWRQSFKWNRARGFNAPWLSIVISTRDRASVPLAAFLTDATTTRRIPLIGEGDNQ